MGAGLKMVGHSGLSFLSPEGWLDFEKHESDLRGSRGVTVVGCLMLYMALSNFWNTVRLPLCLGHVGCVVMTAMGWALMFKASGCCDLSAPSSLLPLHYFQYSTCLASMYSGLTGSWAPWNDSQQGCSGAEVW